MRSKIQIIQNEQASSNDSFTSIEEYSSNNEDAIELNQTNLPILSNESWYHHGQLWLENTYLQPFRRTSMWFIETVRVKDNTRNGYIEREIHGAMHASRVAWSTVMLHRLCQQQYPDSVAHKFKTLLQYFDLQEDEALCLMRYVALGHDAAREGECEDRWEEESTKLVQHFLSSHKIEIEQSIIWSKLASMKDKPQELESFLEARGLSKEVIEGLQYIRLLISLADGFDIIRCVSEFEFAFIEEKLAEVFKYQPEKDGPVFFEYAQNLFQLLKNQQDLYFPTKLIGPNKLIYRLDEGEADYSPRAKTALEHAPNAIIAMQKSFQRHSYFNQLLAIESPVEKIHAEIAPAFNPYIHGTNSATLALMTKTDFQLMSPVEMLEKYQRSPLCGELTKGGLSNAMATGKPCFARLNGEDHSNGYTLKRVILNCACGSKPYSIDNCKTALKSYCENSKESLFSSISIINIYLARAKQLGINLEDIPEVQSLERNFAQSMDIFYLYLLFSTRIVSNYRHYRSLPIEERKIFMGVLDAHLSTEKVLEKLGELNISVRDIYLNPTKDNCQKVIDILCLPEEISHSPLFEYTTIPIEDRNECSDLDSNYGYVFRNVSSWEFEYMLKDVITGRHKMGNFQDLAPHLQKYLEIIEKRFDVTKKLLRTHSAPLTFSDEDLDLVNNSFPLILVYNQDKNMRIFSKINQEYRAQKPLILGQDILMVATNNEKNKKRLQNYMDRHQLNVTVITFKALKHAKLSLYTEHPLSLEEVMQFDMPLSRQEADENTTLQVLPESTQEVNALVSIGLFAKSKLQDAEAGSQMVMAANFR